MMFNELETLERVTPSKYGSDMTDYLKGQKWGRRLHNTALGLREHIEATEKVFDTEFTAEDRRAILISCMIWGDRNGLTSIIIDNHPIYMRLTELAEHFHDSLHQSIDSWRMLWEEHRGEDPGWEEIIDISPPDALIIIAGLERKLESEE